LTYRANAELDKFIAKKIAFKKSDVDFTQGWRAAHAWVISDEDGIKFVETQFLNHPVSLHCRWPSSLRGGSADF